MSQVLNQHHDTLVCSQCLKYLSVFPVKVYQGGNVKCGRCCQIDDGGVESLYQELAKHCLFKCINRYDGCRKLLHPSTVIEHEETCRGRVFDCFKCDINPQMSACQLIQHYKQNHKKSLLTSNIFFFKIDRSNRINEAYLYVQDDDIFIILLKYARGGPDLYLSALTFRELEGVQQQFIISVDALNINLSTKKQKCFSVRAVNVENKDNYCKVNVSNLKYKEVKCEILLDMSEKPVCTTEIQFPRQIKDEHNFTAVSECSMVEPQTSHVELTPEFNEHFPQYNLTRSGTALYSNAKKKKIELTCSNCKKMMAERVFICDAKKHFLCWDCSTWCNLCEYSNDVTPEEVTALSKYLLFSCKWKCGVKCSLDELEIHEICCPMNKRECPICYTIIDAALPYHMKNVHQSKLSEYFNLADFLEKYKDTLKVEEYFIMNNHMFKIVCKRTLLLKKTETPESSNFVYNLRIIPCDNLNGLELFVNVGETCHKLENGEMTVGREEEPQLFLKYFQ